MAFDVQSWQERVSRRLEGWKPRWEQARAAGVTSLYAFLSAMALWPVIEAARQGEWAALMALGSVAAGVGGNLLADQIQSWKDETDAARKLTQAAEESGEVRAALDAVLKRLEVVTLARSGLDESDREWFTGALREELARLGNLASYRVVLARDHAVAVGGDVYGDVIVGARPPGPRSADLRSAYLNHLFETVGGLSLAGIDPKAASDTETRLDLGAVYTALLTLTSEECERMQKEARFTPQGRTRERTSVLTQLDRCPRLVLLGDPGSGKSTFVNFVALCLAGEALGRGEANLARLTEPLPADDEDEDEQQRPQPWSHGPLLPVRVVLRDFAARGLPPAGERTSAKHLWDFIAAELEAHTLGDYAPLLEQELRERGGLLLLDGLDEVPEAERRREQIKQAVEDFVATFPRCRVLVTSRTYAYQQQAWRLPHFVETILAPFGDGQIRRFVDRWYVHIGQLRGLHPDDAQGRAELLKRAIFGSDRLHGLAERPLLLTLMASLHAWRGGSLPEKREELYADTVDLLLDWWERPKVVRDAQGRVTVQQPSLAEWLQVDRARVRSLLNELAYRAHKSQPDVVGTADVPEGDLLSGLMRLSRNPEVENNPALLVNYLSQRAGLLLPRGVGVYTFPHRTFQEYLAACHLTDHDYPDEVAKLVRADPNRWREVALLAGAKAARGSASSIWLLVDALCHRDVEQDGILPVEDAWGALLAGQALVESADLERVSEHNQPKLERVRAHLAYHVLQADGLEGRPSLPAVERAAAGRALSRLGDPRFRPDAWFLPDDPLLGFVRIPAGPFIMGSREESDPFPVVEGREIHTPPDPMAYDDEKPQHVVNLPEYYIARYPVTVAQWRVFVQASGHEPVDERSLRDPDNHPVRYVTWYEAVAYARWLDERLKARARDLSGLWAGLALGKLQVTLPSEAEWEKAARGPLTPHPPRLTAGHPLPSPARGRGVRAGEGREGRPARVYPWGDEPDPNRANYDDTGIGTTSAVGCFPGGASPYGVEELSGNVWEWTRSLWGGDWRKPDFGYPYDPGDGREDLEAGRDVRRVLRGGSFGGYRRGVRCAFRLRDSPHSHWDSFGFRVGVVASPSALDSEPSEL